MSHMGASLKVEMPHEGHDQHLCYLRNIGVMRKNFGEFKELVKEANFICKNCGRTASSDKSLCEPEPL